MNSPLNTVRAYHRAWTHHQFAAAADHLAADLAVEVPINHYPTKASFVEALTGFGSLVTAVTLLAEMADGPDAMQLYDMDVQGIGPMRVAEHFTVRGEQIVRLRQIHDTAPLRPAHQDPSSPTSAQPAGFAHDWTVAAPPARVFAALTTLEGLAGWWTPQVTGQTAAGGRLMFRFPGLSEIIRMEVEQTVAPERVTWRCEDHSGHPEWRGTQIHFTIEPTASGGSRLTVHHEGLRPQLDCYEECASSWELFGSSIASWAETGVGQPFGGTVTG